MLEPENNVGVQCDSFYETITILNEPGKISVRLLIYNLSSEINLNQLTMTIASYSNIFDKNMIRIYDTEQGENVPVELIGTRYENYLGIYLHQFRLTFDPPISDELRTTEISYTTNGSKWNEDNTAMVLYVKAWSTRILPKYLSVISLEGEGEAFKIDPVLKFTLVGFFDIYKSEQRYGVYIWRENLISYPDIEIPIYANFTPAYPSQWHMWNLYQNIEDLIKRNNELLEQNNELLQKTENILNSAEQGINATRDWAIISIVVAAIITAGVSLFFTRREKRGNYNIQINTEVETSMSTDKNRKIDKLDSLLLSLTSGSVILINIAISLGSKWLIPTLPLLIPVYVLPIYFGYVKGAIFERVEERALGWVYFVVGLLLYPNLITYFSVTENATVLEPALGAMFSLAFVIPATWFVAQYIGEKVYEIGGKKIPVKIKRSTVLYKAVIPSTIITFACYYAALFLFYFFNENIWNLIYMLTALLLLFIFAIYTSHTPSKNSN